MATPFLLTPNKHRVVRWEWKGDDNQWITFSQQQMEILEKSFKNKERRAKIDDQRFVDLKLFLQVRYDDKSKQREVQRVKAPNIIVEDSDATDESDHEAEILPKLVNVQKKPAQIPDLFEESLFYILGKKQDQIVDQIESSGGIVLEIINSRVTHVICENSNFLEDERYFLELQEIEKYDHILIVSPDFVKNSIKNGKKENEQLYLIQKSKKEKSSKFSRKGEKKEKRFIRFR